MLEDDLELPWPQHIEAERRAYLKQRLERWQKAAQPNGRPEYSLRYRLLDEITKDAIARIAGDHARDLQRALDDADDLVGQLCYAATSSEVEWENREQLNFWRHAAQPAYEIKRKTYRLNLKGEVEGLAAFYVSQPLRGSLFDRTLVDILLALELYQFADEMIYPYRFPGIPVLSPLKQPHPLWAFARNNVIALLGFGALFWAFGFGWIAGIYAGLWGIGAVWQLVALPFSWRRWSRGRKKTLAILDAMLTTYAQMQSDSVISASHVLDAVKASSALGVIWPSPLYVVLEDVISRGGRL